MNLEILEKAIQKAEGNGWKRQFLTHEPMSEWDFDEETSVFSEGIYDDKESVSATDYIFNHDFAKALWGEKWEPAKANTILPYQALKSWEYHLQQMVIADDPIKYLGENL